MSLQKVIFIILFAILSVVGFNSKNIYNVVMSYERYSASLKTRSITLDFGEIVYAENDTKSDVTLVLVHGFGGNKDTWNWIIPEWNDKYHIIAIDLPGHGESVSEKRLNYTMTDQAQRLFQFVEAKGLKHFYLLGHSMGGAVALKFAGEHEAYLKGLVLIDSLGLEKTKSDGVKLVERSEKNPLYDVCTLERLETLLHYSMYKPPYIPDMIKEALLEEKCARRDLEKILYEDMYKDVCCLNDIAKHIHVPTLILWGDQDKMTHIDNATLFHETIEGSSLVILKQIGHVPILEDPERTAEAIDRFIQKTEPYHKDMYTATQRVQNN